MVQQFIDREEELEFLEKLYKERKSNLLIVYGRRRVGKTELIKQFIKGKPHLYFLADDRGDSQNLKELQYFMAEFLDEELFKKAKIKDWIELFSEFFKILKNKIIIVIDEFPYLIKSNKAIPSIFQKIWDNILSNKDVYLILLGSSISMMETHTLAYRSPLYGRRTGQLKILPFKFRYLHNFFPNYSLEDIIKVYSITDGIPAYMLTLNPNISFYENLKENILKPGRFLYQEVEILLKEELREQANYFNILKSIAMGRTKFGEIVNCTGLDKTLVSKYLNTLILLHVIKKEFSVTEKKETRNARYIFEDNYYNFWFKFIYPNRTFIEGGKVEELIENVKKDMNLYFSLIFEKICKEFLFYKQKISFNKVGRWWYKDKEIDIVILNEKTKEILFAECKWQDKVNAEKILYELKEKVRFVDWNNEKRKEYYAIFAKSFKKKIKEQNVMLFDLKDLERYFLNF